MNGFNHPPTPGPRPSSTRGVALVVVLGMLVLVLVLVVAFLSSVSVELQSAKKYSSGADARALADSAVSLVISQIQDATAKPQLAWASQPGMIRTYTGSGTMDTAYKLYSSGELRFSGSYNPAADVPGTWAGNASLYTDLNKPVAVSGTNHYPIIDPMAVASGTSGGAPLSGTSAPIEGCYLDTGNAAVATTATQTNPVPMPVQWMYVLESGKLAAMDPASSTVAGASAADAIVGRIAFWTDDETSKVNINTASEGTFWDRPWVVSSTASTVSGYEFRMATTVPAQNEFQRYPGHPAMTSLSPIFPPISGETTTGYSERIYSIIPRVVGGGSMGGTVYIGTGSAAALLPDTDRLFSSVDEFIFSATNIVSGSRVPNASGPSNTFSVADLEKSRFFLTANSRAPEVNMFNKPRIALWPLQANTSDVGDPTGSTDRNAKDNLIAFCSTIGNTPYYFQRFNTSSAATPSSQSPTMDWTAIPRNRQLYAYLQNLTDAPIPGLGGSLLGKYPGSRDQILTQAMDFIRSNINTMPATGTTGYSYALFSKPSGKGFVPGQSQIVPLVLPNGTKGFGRFPTVIQAAMVFYRTDHLIASGTTAVEGPPPYHMRAVLILQPFNPSPGVPPWSSYVRYELGSMNEFTIASPIQIPLPPGVPMGFTSPASNLVTGIDGELNSTALSGFEQCFQYFNPSTTKFTNAKTLGVGGEESYPFFSSELVVTGTRFMFSGGNFTVKIYPGHPDTTNQLVQTVEMNFPPVELPLPTVPLASGTDSGSRMANNAYTNFDTRFTRTSPPTNQRYGILEDGQHKPLPIIQGGDVVRAAEPRFGGVLRGDFRLIAGLATVPESFFEGRGMKDPQTSGNLYKYNDLFLNTSDARARIHSLRIDGDGPSADTGSSNGFYFGYGGTLDPRGKLVAGAAYRDPNRGNNTRASKIPVAPRHLEGAFMNNGSPGDWDTGPGSQGDGPYINRADEGGSNKSQAGSSNYYALGGYINASGVIENGSSFAPNRQIASAVAFGSLPSGIDPANPGNSAPWQTLLFCKNPAAGANHPGFGTPASGPSYDTPPDHAFLDFFTMPIVEPYAISEPFSTAGKVNMNYQIVPFTYLTRSTGVRAVLKSTNVMAIPQSDAATYKYNAANNTPDYRYKINPDEGTGTLAGFRQRFASGDIFRSASEICDIYLVPGASVNAGLAAANATYANMNTWWDGYRLTGDNVREGPYGHIYPRLTTKSNTFTVHVQAQSISKSNGTPADQFVDGKDKITGEFRGSFLIERYLDPNSDSLVNSAGAPTNELDPDGMVGPYKFRVINSKRFAP